MTPVLEAHDLCHRYRGGGVGLDGATLALLPGEKVALLGPNGCGKTTLLLHLCGVLRPETGQVLLDGRAIEFSRAGLRTLRQAVGTLLQDAEEQLFASSVYEDVSFGPLNLGLATSEVRLRVDESLASLGIAHLADRPPHRLSLGQKKRVALAGIVAMKPRVILLDEPTAGLDPAGVDQLLEILDRLQASGTQITFATHDVDLAYGFADRVAILCRGQVIAAGSPESIFEQTELLKTSSLRRPWAAQVGEVLRSAGIAPTDGAWPRMSDAFLKQLAALRIPSR